MTKMDRAIERINILECPTGEVEERLRGILEDYGIAKSEEIKIEQRDVSETTGTQGYSIHLPENNCGPINVIAQSGMDDYVATVTDVYME